MGDVTPMGSIRFRERRSAGCRLRIARKGLGYVPENRDIFPTPHRAPELCCSASRTRAATGRWTMDDMFGMFPALRERADTPAACSPAASSRC
jgi:branched-chain amino acid transport system ATP-binding protein